MKILDIIKNPSKAVKAAKKQDYGKTFLVLVVCAVLFGVASFILATVWWQALLTMIIVFLATMLTGLILGTLMFYLTSNGFFYEGLTTMTYSLFPFALGAVLLSILFTVFLPVGIISLVLSAVLMILIFVFSAAISFALFFRVAKELYKTDMITVFIAYIFLWIVMSFGYIGMYFAFMATKLFPLFSMGGFMGGF